MRWNLKVICSGSFAISDETQAALGGVDLVVINVTRDTALLGLAALGFPGFRRRK